MQVSFYATLRRRVGAKRIEVPVPADASLQQVLDAVLAACPELAEDLLDESGGLSRHIHLFVDGRSSKYLPEGLATRLAPGQSVQLFPAVAGG